MTTKWSQKDGRLSRLLRRDPLPILVPDISEQQILITGGGGFVGQRVARLASDLGASVDITDIDRLDVTSALKVDEYFYRYRPDIVIHLAAHKYATTAEDIPWEISELNILGTLNIAKACETYKARCIFASTCKAADPCTAYGASKLIAERVALKHKAVVFRLVNVIGSSGSLIQIWDDLPEDSNLPVTNCVRYWISPDEAAAMLLSVIYYDSSIYAPNHKSIIPCSIRTIAWRYDSKRQVDDMPLRKGDRAVERLVGEYEEGIPITDTIMYIKGPWQ